MPIELTVTQFALIVGVISGFIFGLIPLILGLRKQNRRYAFLGFVLTILAGAFFSLLGALPVAAVFVWLILKKPGETAPPAQTVNESAAENSVKDSENS